MLSSTVFFLASWVCFMIPNMKDEEMRQRGWSHVEHEFGIWDYTGMLIFCVAVGIMVAGIWLSDQE